MQRCCANLKAVKYKSTGLNKIMDDKSHLVIVALVISSRSLSDTIGLLLSKTSVEIYHMLER